MLIPNYFHRTRFYTLSVWIVPCGFLQRETFRNCFLQINVFLNTAPVMGFRSTCLQREQTPLIRKIKTFTLGGITVLFNSGNLPLHRATNRLLSFPTSKSTINLPFSTPSITNSIFKGNRWYWIQKIKVWKFCFLL